MNWELGFEPKFQMSQNVPFVKINYNHDKFARAYISSVLFLDTRSKVNNDQYRLQYLNFGALLKRRRYNYDKLFYFENAFTTSMRIILRSFGTKSDEFQDLV